MKRWLWLGLFAVKAFAGDVPDQLPKDLKWETNDTDPVFASPEAKKGGTFHDHISSFPPTIRFLGPDANNASRDKVLYNFFTLIDIHPNTDKVIPLLATHWAFGKDHKSMYFRLRKNARWSDGKPITADDFVFTDEMMRSKWIVDPSSTELYVADIAALKKYDDVTIGIFAPRPKPDIYFYLNIAPYPKHFFAPLDKDFVTKFNWTPPPTSGAYKISAVNKGKSIILERVKDWWGENERYLKNRFNVDRIEYSVVREENVSFEMFKKGDIDAYFVTRPTDWHQKAQGELFEKGFIKKLWAYNDIPQSPQGIFLNEDFPLFKDKNVRIAFAYAMNFEKLIKTMLHNDYERLNSESIGYGAYTNPKIKARPFDLAKADEYLKKAGWIERGPDGVRVKDGQRLSATLSYSIDSFTQRYVILREEALKAGIEMKLNLMDETAAYKQAMEKKHEMTYWAWTTNPRPEYWQGWHSANAHKAQSNNITNIDNKELDTLIDKYRNSVEEKDRISFAHQIQQMIHDECVFIPSYDVPFIRYAYWRYWRLPKPPATKSTDGNIFEPLHSQYGGLFWLDENLKKETLAAKSEGKSFPPVTEVDKTFKK